MINVKKEVFLKKLFLFLCVFGQQKNRTNEDGEAQKAQDTALKAADSKKRRTLSKARGIGAEMSCRRRDGAGQSGSFASVKARGSFASVKVREAANCSGKPGARRLRRARARKKEAFTSSDLSIKFKLALHLFLIYNANMNMVDLIRKKRDCQTLSAAELRFIVDG